MKRRNEIKSSIGQFSMENVIGLLKSDPIHFFSVLEHFSEREIIANDIDGIDRKLLYTWKKKGLLPYETDSTRARFSFIEVCWLYLILELRKIGIDANRIKELKEFLFNSYTTQDLMKGSIADADLDLLQDDLKQLVKENVLSHNGEIKINNQQLVELEKLQCSLFSMSLYSIMLKRSNVCIYIDNNEKMAAFDLNDIIDKPNDNIISLIEAMSNNTIVLVNLKKIIAQVADANEFFDKKMQLKFSLNEMSIEHLKELFEKGEVDEITIKYSDKGKPIMLKKKYMEISQLQKEVYELRKKGNFSDLVIKTRNGNIQYFEKTEIIKL